MRIVLGLLMVLALGGEAASASKVRPDPAKYDVVAAPPAGVTPRAVALTKLGTSLQPGQVVGNYYNDDGLQPTWDEESAGLVSLDQVFREELAAAGFKADRGANDLFTEASTGDLQVGAVVTGMDIDAIVGLTKVHYVTTITLQWQVYSTLQREVLATIDTTASSDTRHKIPPRPGPPLSRTRAQSAFAANIRALLSNEDFRRIVLTPAPVRPTGIGVSNAREPLRVAGMGTTTMPIADATGSVVAIFAGSGMGSGVLISAEGYLLTNEHVVGAETRVRVRWSDGLETIGEVLRVDKRRDVALVKTQPRARPPLVLKPTLLAPGAPVFAIGTPLDPKLQNTVTKGIVSANRTIEGLGFIQSDVSINSGNSGGPLLDESGRVVGLAVSGIMQGEAPSGINLFIPIGDALDFLAIQPAG
jgi:serine protease Do